MLAGNFSAESILYNIMVLLEPSDMMPFLLSSQQCPKKVLLVIPKLIPRNKLSTFVPFASSFFSSLSYCSIPEEVQLQTVTIPNIANKYVNFLILILLIFVEIFLVDHCSWLQLPGSFSYFLSSEYLLPLLL